MSLVKRISDNLSEQVNAAQRAADKERRIAQAYDAHCAGNPGAMVDCPEPDYIYTHGIYGAVGGLGWKNATPEEAAALMRAFPPVPTVLYRDRFVSARPLGAVPENRPESSTVRDIDGYYIKVDRTAHYATQARVEWDSIIGGVQISCSVELRAILGVTPHIEGLVKRNKATGQILEITCVQLKYGITPAKPLEQIRYAAGSRTSFNSFLLFGQGGSVLEYIDQLAAHCLATKQASRKAYLQDKERGLDPVADDSRGDYDSQTLRAGTREQWEALRTVDARKDRALAQAHWTEYAKDHGIETRTNYFDYYDWACSYLRRIGMYEVTHNGKPYKYGQAWL